MQCRSCQATLEPGATSCSRCSTSLMTMNDAYDEAAPYTDRIPYVDQKMLAQRKAGAAVALPATPVPQERETQAQLLARLEAVALPATPVPQEQQTPPIEAAPATPRRTDKTPDWMIALLMVFPLLLVLEGSGFLTYTAAFRSSDFHTQATAVAHNVLTAQAQSTVQARTVAMAAADREAPDQVYMEATRGAPIIDDSLQDTSGNVWFNYGPLCGFSEDAYHVIVPKAGPNYCVGANTQLGDLAFQVQLMNIKGGIGGLIFRLNSDTNKHTSGYDFEVDTEGQYFLTDFNTQTRSTLLKRGVSPTFEAGLNQTNTLMVIARGSTIYMYVNGQFVSKVTNTAHTTGQIALLADDDADATDIAFSNVKVWAL